MTIEALLAPVSEEMPCGINLEYDNDFQAMEQAGQGKAEQQFGSTIIPAEPADWNRVAKLAEKLLTQSKDLRVMLALTRAWTQLKGLPGCAMGLQLINQTLQQYWDQVHPLLMVDGEDDSWFRINAFAQLGDSAALSLAIRNAPLLRSAADVLSLRDAAALLDGSKTELDEFPGGRPRLLDELTRAEQPGVTALAQILPALESIHALVTDKLGAGAMPEMKQLFRTLNTVQQENQATDLSALIPQAEQGTEAGPVSQAPAAAAPRAAVQDWRSATLSSRDDAQLMLEKVKQYFIQHEPGHPAPLMVERVQRMMTLDFMEMVRDLAPDGVHQLETLFGRRNG
ncbi:type VI secretion system protein TssA [Candidatus Pantoea multigeneris]|uniref:Type VI secretion system protein TssA n=1 Tax=Candidatus Pantoea multigeneris TaxID=2608357 RepID=A0ABX0R569_9GAMM|nr:type VI secretion system protein TssA [Pantoea multigeneris]NIF20232.1 type VI secretion system protein TssA [Pantoea multigeneris]